MSVLKRVIVFLTKNRGVIYYAIRVKRLRGRSERSRSVVARYPRRDMAEKVAEYLREGLELYDAQKKAERSIRSKDAAEKRKKS